MLCQACQKNQATTHIKNIINGELTEKHLCPECAAKQGYGNVFDHMFDIGSFMSGFMGEPSFALASEKRCPNCGITLSQITKGGRVGCARCYDVFYDRLLPSIKRIHGNTYHTGKRLKKPQLASGENSTETEVKPSPKSEIESLGAELQAAVKAQEFEKAAQLRDRINALKAEQGGNI